MNESPIMSGSQLIVSLCDALGFDANRVSRIVIDADVQNVVKVYIEGFGDTRLLKLDWPGQLKHVQINREDKPTTE